MSTSIYMGRERERECGSDPLPLHIAPSLYTVGGVSHSIYRGRDPLALSLYIYIEEEISPFCICFPFPRTLYIRGVRQCPPPAY